MLAVVVLSYRARPGMLRRCVDAVAAGGDTDALIVVDNGGEVAADDLPDGAVLLRPTDNRGYAGGMNEGIRRAIELGATAVALLNDDTVVRPGWLAALHAELDPGRRIGAVQPKLLLTADPPVLQSAGIRWRGDGAGIDVGYGEPDRGQYDARRELGLFSGAAVLMAREFLDDVGGFDERYFLYYEDIDLALRGREAGWSYRFVPEAVTVHEMSATTAADPERRRYWQERNRLWCLLRHGSPLAIGRGVVLSLARLAKARSRAQASAIVDGLAAAPRLWRERRHRVRFPVA